MTPEVDCLRKNFDLIAESIRNSLKGSGPCSLSEEVKSLGRQRASTAHEAGSTPVRDSSSTQRSAEGAAGCREARANPEAALKSHLEAHDTFLAFGRCNE